jgi:hypothetical protein
VFCEELGITREMVRLLRAWSDGKKVADYNADPIADALTALLDAASPP